MYNIKLHPKINDDLKKLDKSVKEQVFRKLKKIQKKPELGLSLGNKNNLNLSGLKKIYISKKKIRIVYRIIDDKIEIFVIAIEKRDDMEVYKKASKRLSLD